MILVGLYMCGACVLHMLLVPSANGVAHVVANPDLTARKAYISVLVRCEVLPLWRILCFEF